MAITTYAELQAAAANWLVRRDLSFRIPEFIALAEARLNRKVRKRQAEVESNLTGVPGSRFINLPAAFAEAVQCWIVTDGQREGLDYREPALSDAIAVASRPRYWGIDGPNLAFEAPCDQAYSLVLRYLAKYALSDAAPTNTLLTDAPDVYLFATLAEAGPFLRDNELASNYEAKLGRAIQELNTKDNRSKSMQAIQLEPAALLQTGHRGYNILTDR